MRWVRTSPRQGGFHRGGLGVYLGVVQNHPVQKIGVFLGKMAGKDKKVTFCYISISYLNIEIRYVLRPSQKIGLIRFYHGNRQTAEVLYSVTQLSDAFVT